MSPLAKKYDIPITANDEFKLVESSDETNSDSGISSSPFYSSSEEEGCISIAADLKQKRKARRSNAPHPYRKICQQSSATADSFENSLNALELDGNLKESLECKALTVVAELKNFVSKILSVEKFSSFDCYSHAKRLVNVSIVMTKSLQLGNFLAMFSHSVACQKPQCTTSCRMLRRVRSHVIKADHSCALMHVYGQLLRLHVDTCHENNGRCGMKSCKGMRDMRQAQGHQVLPRNFRSNERKMAEILKDKIIEGNTDTEEVAAPTYNKGSPMEEVSAPLPLDLSKSALIRAK